MPTYEYRCKVCKNEFESFKSIENRNEPVSCETCGKDTERLIGSLIDNDKTLGYYDESLGKYIGSSSDKRKILKEMGLLEVGTRRDMDSYNNRLSSNFRRENDAKLKRSIIEGVKQTKARFG